MSKKSNHFYLHTISVERIYVSEASSCTNEAVLDPLAYQEAEGHSALPVFMVSPMKQTEVRKVQPSNNTTNEDKFVLQQQAQRIRMLELEFELQKEKNRHQELMNRAKELEIQQTLMEKADKTIDWNCNFCIH